LGSSGRLVGTISTFPWDEHIPKTVWKFIKQRLGNFTARTSASNKTWKLYCKYIKLFQQRPGNFTASRIVPKGFEAFTASIFLFIKNGLETLLQAYLLQTRPGNFTASRTVPKTASMDILQLSNDQRCPKKASRTIIANNVHLFGVPFFLTTCSENSCTSITNTYGPGRETADSVIPKFRND